MVTNSFDNIQDFLENFRSFIESDKRNSWILVDGIKMYVRKSTRYFNEDFVECLDIASIEIEIRGDGTFTNILTLLLKTYPDSNFFVESILNPKLPKFLMKFGFVRYREDDMILIRNKKH